VALNTVQEFTGTAKVPDRLAVYDAAVNIDGTSTPRGWTDSRTPSTAARWATP
jgi:hypothetical protein